MQAVGGGGVGVDVEHRVFEFVQLRYLYVGCEHRHHDGYGVALFEQMVLLEHVEAVAHSGRGAFDCE